MSSRIKLPFKLGDSKKTNESEITETIRKEDFSLSEIVRYGFPFLPTTFAYDSVQKILAIGTKFGVIKIYGGAFVDCSLLHPTEVEIVQLLFRINEGALISACRDNCVHLWNLRQKKPVIANTLRFTKEKISRCLLPLAFNSKWLLVGTASGNIYVANLDNFQLSSYKIMWNNAIGMGKNMHPGAVVDLSQNPDDPARLFIGFSKHGTPGATGPLGLVVCWNLQQKTSETVYTLEKGLTSLSWHFEGRQFMCSHCDGSLTVWNLKSTDRPVSINHPHARISKDETLRLGQINKVVWSSIKSSGESFIIFSGGMPPPTDQQQAPGVNAAPQKPSSHFLTIVRGQTTNVLHMDNAIVDFLVITPSPHIADVPDPSAVVVLLENDLVVIDLKSENYPLFESSHTLDLHESPVTYCDYITEPNNNFYQNLLLLQSRQTPKRSFSQLENPISGGKSGTTIFGYNELILTGHADGSIKFWDASGCNLCFLYKIRTNRLFDRVQTHLTSNNPNPNRENNVQSRSLRATSQTTDEQVQQVSTSNETNPYENPFAIYSIKLCCDGKYLIGAARGGHVTLFKFTGSELEKSDEGLGDLSCLDVPILHRNLSSDLDETNQSGNLSTINENSSRQIAEKKEFKSLLRAKMGYRRFPGYQPELVCLLSWLPTDKVPVLSDIAINSKYGLLIFGLDNGLVVIDYLSQSILMNMATGDLYGTMDPFQRSSASPKRRTGTSNESANDDLATADHQQHSPPSTLSTTTNFNNSTLAEKRGQFANDSSPSIYKGGGSEIQRSSSNSSIDGIVTNESVCSILFSESFTYKNDNTISPSVWLGTSRGCVIVVNLNIIYEPRNISVVPSGSVFRLCGRIVHSSFLDHKGVILSAPSEKWDTKKAKINRNVDTFAQTQDSSSSTVLPGSGSASLSGSSVTSPTTTTSIHTQYAVFCSSRQARVVSLPSQVCFSKYKFEEVPGGSTLNVLRAAVVKIKESPCLACYSAAGRIQVYSLPSLRQFFTTNLESMVDSFRTLIGSTFTFTNRGHGLYMCTPTEIQKITIASEIKEHISDMLCDLYSPSIVMPEAPKPNFIVKLFSSNTAVDTDQLFGEAAGKAPYGIAKKEDVNYNINQMRGKVDSATGVVNETRMKLVERGQKLGELEMQSKQLVEGAEEFASLTHKMMLKQKEKAEWSWPFASKKS